MSNDLRDLFKRELDQIPLRPAETWVPQRRRRGFDVSTLAWQAPLAIAVAVVVVIVAIIGGRQLAAFRDRLVPSSPSRAVVARAIYLSTSNNGSGWIQIDPITLNDLSTKPLLDIAPSSSTGSHSTDVSADGSTIIVSDYSVEGDGRMTVTRRVFDGRTGQLRGYLVTEVPMFLEYLSADGSLGLGPVAQNNAQVNRPYGPPNQEMVLVAIPEGRVVRHLGAFEMPGQIEMDPVSPDLKTRYFFTTPPLLGQAAEQPLPMSLYVRSIDDVTVGPIALPDIAVRTALDSGGAPVRVLPALALSADGTRLAVLSTDGRTLDVIDTRTLAVTTVAVRREEASPAPTASNDATQRGIRFSADGTALFTWSGTTLRGLPDSTGEMQRIEVATGFITAWTSVLSGGIWSLTVSPDGNSVYVITRTNQPQGFTLRRLTHNLVLTTERALLDSRDTALHMIAAPTPRP